ncbi:hypothetical protein ILUMI_13611 [Ignelater luminosus]|uniref:Uncharacterized protein n=1 Tax=Ignelater luminosus TaxID=2038154 RepID=A0A8K0CU46_IGNLU|nr:hypothetical protein ILUMI_13611 [Ignelater luminosus]
MEKILERMTDLTADIKEIRKGHKESQDYILQMQQKLKNMKKGIRELQIKIKQLGEDKMKNRNRNISFLVDATKKDTIHEKKENYREEDLRDRIEKLERDKIRNNIVITGLKVSIEQTKKN